MKRLTIALTVTILATNAFAWYQAEQGRWLSRDPIHEKGSVAYRHEKPKLLRPPVNLYMYCANNPIIYYDKNGLAYFALRPLGGKPWIPIGSHNPIDDWLNTEISHEQIFFEDGKSTANVGFFDDNKIRSDAQNLLAGYRTTSAGYNDCVMRIAVAQTPTQPYSLLGWGKPNKFNCQDFAEAARTLYSKLVRDPAIQRKCCPKKEEIK